MILIIGAGLTGLSAAYHLGQHGIDDIIVCEKNRTPGGLLRTARVNGFTFDHTGHFLHINDRYFASFLRQICDLKTFDHIHRRSAVYTHGRITPYPFQMNLHGLPTDVITDCITGFVNRKRSKQSPRTFYEWVYKHFGTGIGKHFFFPFQRKILSYDLRKIEPSWTGRFVPKTDLKTMLEGALYPRQPAQKVGYNSDLIYPSSGGIDHVITALDKATNLSVQTEHELVSVDPVRKVATFSNGRTITYTHLISTAPLNHLLSSLNGATNTTLANQANHLRCNSVLNINVGIAKPNIGIPHWLYVSDPSLPFYRLGFWHNICPALAPKNHSSVYAELSFMPGRITKKELERKRAQSLEGIKKILSIGTDDIVLEHDLLLSHAYVIYDQWRKKNLPRLLARLGELNIHSIGRFGEWKYSSMQEAVLDGRTIADTLAAHYTNYKIPRHKDHHATLSG